MCFSFLQTNQHEGQQGFTLLEVLLSVALIAAIAGMSIPIYLSFQNRNELDIASVTVAQTLRRAQVLAQASDGDSSWGVHMGSTTITLFQGASYATRSSGFDEVFQVPENIESSGLTEVVFEKFTGTPNTTGTLTYTSPANETREITLNSEGMVQY